jgi:hypothetical protein
VFLHENFLYKFGGSENNPSIKLSRFKIIQEKEEAKENEKE